MPKTSTDTLRKDLDDENRQKETAQIAIKKEELPDSVTITNGANEGPFGMTLEPNYLIFRYVGNAQAFSHFNVTNSTKVKQAFKIKTNNSKYYAIRPSIGFLEPDAKCYVRVTFLNFEKNTGVNEKCHVAIFHRQVDAFPTMPPRCVDKPDDPKAVGEAFRKAWDPSPYQIGVHHFYCTHRQEIVGDGAEDQ